jgi:hypothetical protein
LRATSTNATIPSGAAAPAAATRTVLTSALFLVWVGAAFLGLHAALLFWLVPPPAARVCSPAATTAAPRPGG